MFPKPSSVKKPPKPLRSRQRKEWEAERASRPRAPVQPLTRRVNVARIEVEPKAQPKRQYIRSPELLANCQHVACQHCGRAEKGTVCAAHSNWHQHGKGAHIKADDNQIAALCDRCHIPILDQGSKLSKAERQAMWFAAHIKTVDALTRAGLWPLDVPIPDTRRFNA